MMTPLERHKLVGKAFEQQYGGGPSVWVRAPGRVDLMGSHTDYNLGFVLTLPIHRDTWLAVRPRADRQVHVFSLNLNSGNAFDLDGFGCVPGQHWSNYIRGVAMVLQANGFKLAGFDAVIHSTVPIGGGLSSSAALECAVATACEAVGGFQIEPVRKAQLCQRAENEVVGVNCGILDQYTSCLGEAGAALLLDCRELSSRAVRLPEGLQVVIGDTRFKRELAGSEYGKRRAQCEQGGRLLGVPSLREISLEQLAAREHVLPPEVAKRCRFIVEENDRVVRLAEALALDERATVQQLTGASFRGACELYEIGVPAMHAMNQAMLGAPGVIGARQAGAGFGGCLVAFVQREQVQAFAGSVYRRYKEATGLEPEVSPVTAAAGAGTIAEC